MKKSLALLLAAAALPAFADSWQEVGTIIEVRLDSDENRIKVIGKTDPACSESYLWWDTSRPHSKEWLAIALAAHMSGKKVYGWVGASCHVNKLTVSDE